MDKFFSTATNIMAIIGFFTGTISCGILMKEHRFNMGKIEASIIDPKERNVYSLYFDAHDSKSNPRYAAAIALKITNKSSYPLTIDSLYVSSEKESDRDAPKAYHDNESQYRWLRDYSVPSYPTYMFEEPVRLPCTINAHETKCIGTIYPDITSMVGNYGDDLNLKLTIINSRKKFFN